MDNTRAAFIYAINSVMKEKNLSAYNLAKKIGVTYQAVHTALSLKAGSPTLKNIEDYAMALEVPTREIYKRIGWYLNNGIGEIISEKEIPERKEQGL